MSVGTHGFCEAGFEPIKDAFVANFEAGLEVGASVAVTHHGRPVVDLWAGYADFARTRPWERDTIALVYSSTKIAVILSFLMLVDRGRVELDAPVSRYWPEFSQGGKAAVTVRQALTHRAGVPGFVPPVSFEAMHDWAAMIANLEAQDHWLGGEDRFFYHAITYGYLLGEIIRRVDGRGPARFFREEVAEPAGIDFQMGLTSRDDLKRLAANGFLEPPSSVPTADPLYRRAGESSGAGNWGSWERLSAEIPAAVGLTNGRGLARLCAIFANGGELDGVRYLSKAIVDEASREQVHAPDPYFGEVRLGLGFGLSSGYFTGPTPTAFHWGGYGGSEGVMDQATRLSFGYAMNNLVDGDTGKEWADVVGPRLSRFFDAVREVSKSL